MHLSNHCNHQNLQTPQVRRRIANFFHETVLFWRQLTMARIDRCAMTRTLAVMRMSARVGTLYTGSPCVCCFSFLDEIEICRHTVQMTCVDLSLCRSLYRWSLLHSFWWGLGRHSFSLCPVKFIGLSHQLIVYEIGHEFNFIFVATILEH